MSGWVDGCVYEWVDGCVNGCVSGWFDGWFNGRIGGLVEMCMGWWLYPWVVGLVCDKCGWRGDRSGYRSEGGNSSRGGGGGGDRVSEGVCGWIG